MDWLPRDIAWRIGPALPWDHETADAVIRTRLRVIGTPQAPNQYGMIAIAYHLVALPTHSEGSEIPIATTACVLNAN